MGLRPRPCDRNILAVARGPRSARPRIGGSGPRPRSGGARLGRVATRSPILAPFSIGCRTSVADFSRGGSPATGPPARTATGNARPRTPDRSGIRHERRGGSGHRFSCGDGDGRIAPERNRIRAPGRSLRGRRARRSLRDIGRRAGSPRTTGRPALRARETRPNWRHRVPHRGRPRDAQPKTTGRSSVPRSRGTGRGHGTFSFTGSPVSLEFPPGSRAVYGSPPAGSSFGPSPTAETPFR
jgi:hypothetical protein